MRFFAQKYALNSAPQLMTHIDHTEQETPATPFMPIPEAQRLEMEARYEAEMKELMAPGNSLRFIGMTKSS